MKRAGSFFSDKLTHFDPLVAGGNKRSNVFKQTCLSTCDLLYQALKS